MKLRRKSCASKIETVKFIVRYLLFTIPQFTNEFLFNRAHRYFVKFQVIGIQYIDDLAKCILNVSSVHETAHTLIPFSIASAIF